MFDCIIIGAGPAGCTAAGRLAEKGRKVLLVERCRLPRYKSCSGVLIKKSMDFVKLYIGEETPVHTMCAPEENRGMIFTNDYGKEYRFEQEGLNVWRSSFDNWLAEKAVEKGYSFGTEQWLFPVKNRRILYPLSCMVKRHTQKKQNMSWTAKVLPER